MTPKRAFFRIHRLTFAAGLLLFSAFLLVHVHANMELRYEVSYWRSGKTLIIQEIADSNKGWPYVVERVRRYGSKLRFRTDLNLDSELNILHEFRHRPLLTLDELETNTPTIRSFIPPTTPDRFDYRHRFIHTDESAFFWNLLSWSVAIVVLSTAFEIFFRIKLRKASSRKILQSTLPLAEFRFSLLTLLFFTVLLGSLLGICFSTTKIQTFSFGKELLREAGDDGHSPLKYHSFQDISNYKGWPFIHSQHTASHFAVFKDEKLDERSSEIRALIAHLGGNISNFQFGELSKSDFCSVAPTIFSISTEKWNQFSQPEISSAEYPKLMISNVALCVGVAFLVSVVAEIFQRALRRKTTLLTKMLSPTPLHPSSP